MNVRYLISIFFENTICSLGIKTNEHSVVPRACLGMPVTVYLSGTGESSPWLGPCQ